MGRHHVWSQAVGVLLTSNIFLTICLTSCAGKKAAAPERIAVAPFDNLTSNRDSDWMRRALSEAVATDLAGVTNLYAQSVDSFNSAYAVGASEVVEGYFANSNGRLEIHASVIDLDSKKTAQMFDADGPASEGAIPLVNRVAKELSPAARPFPARNQSAFRSYGEALNASDRESALRLLEAAAKSDPQFGLAYLDWAKLLLSAGDRTGALAVTEAAKRSPVDAIDGAQLDYLAALARGDSAGQQKALESLVRLTPADAKLFGDLAGLEFSERRFRDAVRNYEAALRLQGEQAQLWNEIGYARAYAGDLSGARDALQHYQALVPAENVNPLDSLGEVSFYLGDFAGAEKYFLEADQKNRAEFGGVDLLKAAQARLMAGDLAAADSHFQKYAALIATRDRGRASYLAAQWAFLTGRRKAAMADLEKMVASLEGDGRSLALSQWSVWKLETGDPKGAEDLAAQAGKAAVSAPARNASTLCRVILSPEAANSGPPLADAYALLFARKYAEAVPVLEKLYHQSDPRADGQVRTLLAWAYVETNRTADATGLVEAYPIPLSSGETLLVSLIFPRYLYVRGAVLEQQGKRAEAKAAYELFLKYAGDVPDIFGDDVKARKRVSAL